MSYYIVEHSPLSTAIPVPIPISKEAEELLEFDRMALIDASGVLDFWNDPREDIYTP